MRPYTPRPYFEPAMAFLRATPRANLHAGMGLGKTSIVESLVAELDSPDPTLVLAPYRVARKTWSDEAAEWEHLSGLKVVAATGTPEQRIAALKTRAHIHCINYDNIEWLLEQIPAARWPFKTVIPDESTRLKGYRTRQGGKRAGALATIALRATRWINLTGTPTAKGLTDLWGPQWFIDQGRSLGVSYSAFEARWFYKEAHAGEYAQLQPFQHSFQQITEAIRPTTLAIDAKDWFKLDDPIRTTVRVELPPTARAEYRRMARELYSMIQGQKISAVNAGVKSGKLLQLASGAVYKPDGSWLDVHDEKIEALRSIVEESGGAPVLVSYHYKHALARILKAFPRARQLRTKDDEDDWNAGKIQMLVAHPESAGHGLNLQHGGNILVYFDHTWRVESYLQILERIGPVRQMQSGYKRPVFVYSIVADKTADEAVIANQTGNVSMMDALISSLKVTV